MLIREWMTRDVITVTPATSMLKASKLMKDNDIRRLPVLDDDSRVVGIVSDRDVKDASPSKATTLDMHELYYLLSEIKVKEIMTPDPLSVQMNETIEHVAIMMEEQGYGALPVVDEDAKLVGIITDHDIYKVLIAISGARQGGVQLAFLMEDKPGVLCPILDTLREYDANIVSLLTDRTGPSSEPRHVYIRLQALPRAVEEELIEVCTQRFPLDYWVRESVHEVATA